MTAVASLEGRAAVHSPPRRRAIPTAPTALREIVFASDLSLASDRAFEHARRLAELFGARLAQYHAIEVDDPRDLAAARGGPARVWRRVEQAARAHLARLLAGSPLASAFRIERSLSAGRSLVAFIRGARPDLVVMATHGRGGLARLALGGVTEAVLRETLAPVLCVREPAHGTVFPYRRLLVPTDFSEASRRAFPLAALLARGFGAQVLAVHAVERPALAGVSDAPESLAACEEALLAFFRSDFAGLRVLPRVQLGPAWDGIARTASDDGADLIVMAAGGAPHGPEERALGSRLERVVRTAPCPVLVT